MSKVTLFKPENFEAALGITRHDWPSRSVLTYREITERAADASNDKLEQECARVYGCMLPGEPTIHWGYRQISLDTHQALLIYIEPIEKKC